MFPLIAGSHDCNFYQIQCLKQSFCHVKKILCFICNTYCIPTFLTTSWNGWKLRVWVPWLTSSTSCFSNLSSWNFNLVYIFTILAFRQRCKTKKNIVIKNCCGWGASKLDLRVIRQKKCFPRIGCSSTIYMHGRGIDGMW